MHTHATCTQVQGMGCAALLNIMCSSKNNKIPMSYVLEVYRLNTDQRAVVETGPPALVALQRS